MGKQMRIIMTKYTQYKTLQITQCIKRQREIKPRFQSCPERLLRKIVKILQE